MAIALTPALQVPFPETILITRICLMPRASPIIICNSNVDLVSLARSLFVRMFAGCCGRQFDVLLDLEPLLRVPDPSAINAALVVLVRKEVSLASNWPSSNIDAAVDADTEVGSCRYTYINPVYWTLYGLIGSQLVRCIPKPSTGPALLPYHMLGA